LNQEIAYILQVGTTRTFMLGFVAVIIGTLVALPLGVLGAVYKDSWIDDISKTFSTAGISLPEFWIALLVIMIFSQFWHGWFGSTLIPANGYRPLSEGFVPWFRHIIGPAAVLALPFAATVASITRAEMVDVLNEEYVTAARARGVKERTITWVHALRNAAIPIVTVMGYQAGTIFNGSVLVETVFAYPGLGWYLYRAATNQDFPLVMGITVVIALVFIIINLFADLSYAWLDPRIDYEEASQ
jgi:peptide/nickel transport system permease protein